jgi:Ni/Co efflux regulator RcnB
MKRAALIGTLVASLAAGSAAFADPNGRGHDGHDYDRGRSWSNHGGRHDFDRHDYGRRDFDRRDFRAYVREGYRLPERYGSYYRPHDYYTHRWIRGERLPFAYYERPYVIDDYYGYGLYAPPRGHHWVRVDGDAVLAAVATGIVLDTVFHAFH